MKLEKKSPFPSILCLVVLAVLLPGGLQAAELRGGGTANKCLDAPNANDGTRAQFWSCNDKEFQQWTVLPTGVIQNVNGKCLDWDTADGETNGTRVQIWTCHHGENQQWTLTKGEIRSARRGLCLSSPILSNGKPNTTNGTDLILSKCDGNASQKWIVQ